MKKKSSICIYFSFVFPNDDFRQIIFNYMLQTFFLKGQSYEKFLVFSSGNNAVKSFSQIA